jgi:hypothetical protein
MAAAAIKKTGRLSDNEVAMYLWAETLPLLTPAWDLQDELMTIVEFRGATRSGLRLTAEMGTYIATCCSLYALHRQGYDHTLWPDAPDFALMHQGDDALVLVKKPLDCEGWAEAYAECGFTADLKGSDVFLSMHQRAEQCAAPRVSRLIQQTLSNEHEVTGPPDLAAGLQMVGFLGRAMNAHALPRMFQERVWQTIKIARWIEDALRSGAPRVGLVPFRNWCATDAKADELMRQALEWVKGVSWYESNVRNAEHSPIASAIVAASEAHGADAAAMLALDKLVSQAAQRLNARPWNERRAIIVAIANAKSEGTKAMDAMWAEETVLLAGGVKLNGGNKMPPEDMED